MLKNKCLLQLKDKIYCEERNNRYNIDKLKELEAKLTIYEEMINRINYENLDELYENRFLIYMSLDTLYEKALSTKLYDKFIGVLYKIKNYNDSRTYGEELQTSASIELQTSLKKVFDDYSELYNDISRRKKELKDRDPYIYQCRLLKNKLNYDEYISQYQLEFLKIFVKDHEYSNEEMILLFEAINKHNSNVKNYKIPSQSVVEKMIKKPFYKYNIDPVLEQKYKEKYKGLAIDLCESLLKTDLEDMDEIIDFFPTINDGYNKDEFYYIYASIINRLIEQLENCISIIKEPASYFDYELKKLTVSEYNELYKKFSTVVFLYKENVSFYGEEEKENVIDEEIEYPNELVYLMDNSGEPYIVKDLKDVPQEYYERVKKLLTNKKAGILSSSKDQNLGFNNGRLKGYFKLKEDQVRIVYRHIGDNLYIVLGCFTKKDTIDMSNYNRIAERDFYKKDYSEEELNELRKLGKEQEKYLFDYIEENKRKAHR